MTEDITIGFQNYDPYNQGWYLLPIEGPLKVPYGIEGLTSAQIDVLNSHTLQGLIELVYVRVGNDVLFEGLNGLDQAIETTTNTLQILSSIQELHNSLVTSSLGSFSAWFQYAGSAYGDNRTLYQSNYNSVASAFFGVPIIPDFIFADEDAVIQAQGDDYSYDQFADQLANVRQELQDQVNLLSEQAVGTEDLDDPNSLYNTAKQVLSDLPPLANQVGEPAVAWSDAKLWAMDFYGVNEGQDLAQVKPEEVVIEYGSGPGIWSGVSLNPGNQKGMGTGGIVGSQGVVARADEIQSAIIAQGASFSFALVSHNAVMPAISNVGGQVIVEQDGQMITVNAGTVILTFSGRVAIGQSNTMLQINPIDDAGNVVNPIVSAYIGSYRGPTRGQAQKAGSLQQNITVAITSAQGLNDEQTEEVRAFLFTFEEYYKSASSILTKVSQLIEKYAQGIRPG